MAMGACWARQRGRGGNDDAWWGGDGADGSLAGPAAVAGGDRLGLVAGDEEGPDEELDRVAGAICGH